MLAYDVEVHVTVYIYDLWYLSTNIYTSINIKKIRT